MKVSGKAPPKGWRRDDFGKETVRRTVWTPPWSLRPPTLEPEVWLSLTKKYRDEKRQQWKRDDPKGFERQEERRSCLQSMAPRLHQN